MLQVEQWENREIVEISDCVPLMLNVRLLYAFLCICIAETRALILTVYTLHHWEVRVWI